MRIAIYLIVAFLLPALALAAGIPIDGCVTAPDGRPVSGAQVRLLPVLSMYDSGVRTLRGQGGPEPAERAAVDEEGCFTLSAPEAGRTLRDRASAASRELDFIRLPKRASAG